MLEKMFKLKENNTSVRTEVIAGITTFMTMAYILAVNPNMLGAAGMNPTAVLIATCLASFVGTRPTQNSKTQERKQFYLWRNNTRKL